MSHSNAGPHAIKIALENGVTNVCRFKTAGFESLSGSSGQWDVVLANIYSDLIQSQAVTLRDALSRKGWFAFSGCPVHHSAATRAAILAADLAIEEERIRGRWHTFVGSRRD